MWINYVKRATKTLHILHAVPRIVKYKGINKQRMLLQAFESLFLTIL